MINILARRGEHLTPRPLAASQNQILHLFYLYLYF